MLFVRCVKFPMHSSCCLLLLLLHLLLLPLLIVVVIIIIFFIFQMCKVPELSLASDANAAAYFPLPPLHCSGEDLFYVHNTRLTINQTVLAKRKIDRCEYSAISWQSDASPQLSRAHERDTEPFELKIKHDFCKVECYLKKSGDEERANKNNNKNERRLLSSLDGEKNGINNQVPEQDMKAVAHERVMNQNQKSPDSQLNKQNEEAVVQEAVKNPDDDDDQAVEMENMSPVNYAADDYDDMRFGELPDFEQYIAQIYPTKEILDRLATTKPLKDSLQMNVLIFALDSMSHLSYQRKLPKTYAYLKDNLDAFILKAYNIVGDATTAAIIPLLTGELYKDERAFYGILARPIRFC